MSGVSRSSHFTSITCKQWKLYLLPIEYRIQFEMNLLTLKKTLLSSSPPYFKVYLNRYSSNNNTRCSNRNLNILKTTDYSKKINSYFKHLQHIYAYSAQSCWTIYLFILDPSPKITTFCNITDSNLTYIHLSTHLNYLIIVWRVSRKYHHTQMDYNYLAKDLRQYFLS